LSLLFTLEDQREAALEGARRASASGDVQGMLGEAERAHILRRDEDSLRLLVLGYLLSRDFASAWRFYAAPWQLTENKAPDNSPARI
jgi:hypothetical protein